jgi:diguanylate cyclase (GGDEF)-like protein/PAS domain S-box-containing protein
LTSETAAADLGTVLARLRTQLSGLEIAEHEVPRVASAEPIPLQTLIDWFPDNVWVKDLDSRFVIANKITASRIGVAGPAELIGKSDLDLHPVELARKFLTDERRVIESGEPIIDMEECIVGPSGIKRWMLVTKLPLRNERNEIFGVAGISRDITQRKLAEALREGQAEILQMIAMSAPLEQVLAQLMRLVESQLDGIFGSVLLLEIDKVTLRHGAAPSLPEIYVQAINGARIGPKAGSCGTAVYRREPVIVTDVMSDPLWEDYRQVIGPHGYRSCWSTPILSYQGEVLGVFAMYSKSVREPRAVETRLIEVATRIAGIAIERKHAEDRIQFMATHDALTGLPNRSLLKERLSQALHHAQRYDRWVTAAFVDLDNFKIINDSLGHSAGDELLKIVAGRMLDCVRATDTVVRLGGDEFVIVLFDQPRSPELISSTLQRIRAAIAAPIRVEGRDLRVTSSLGVATYPNDGWDADTLLANADAAMYRAKELGRDNFQLYTPKLNIKVHEKLLLQEELRSAVERSEFLLHYQPQLDLRTGRIFAVEALIRWNHPIRGMISPQSFVPLAEESGLIVPMGDWVLHEACRQNKAWHDAGLSPLSISVNLSARQFRERNLIDRVLNALTITGLAAPFLELELTESVIMQDVAAAVVTMKELRALGVKLAIDDFGTGYSSLSALKRFPVNRLKIDRSFISDIGSNDADRAVTSAVISMGRKLGLKVIAEGVETDEQLAFLRENDCDELQGYRFSRPLPPQEIQELLRQEKRPAGTALRASNSAR